MKIDGLSITELRDKRLNLVNESRAIVNAADTEKRDLTDEERGRFDTMHSDVEVLGNAIKAKESDIARRSRLDGLDTEMSRVTETVLRNQPGESRGAAPTVIEYRNNRLELRKDDERPEYRKLWERSQPEYETAFRASLMKSKVDMSDIERRALQADSDTVGGYLVPTQFVARLIKAVDNVVFVRQHATVIPVTDASSVGMPSLDTNPADFDWTTELATGDEDSSMAFGKRELTPHPLAKRIKISNKLMRLSAINAEDLVMDRFAYVMGVTEEQAFLSGHGAQRPLGVFTASNNGVPTTQDVSTGNSTTAIAADNLINVKYTLKSQYWPRARWTFHRDAVKMIAKLKDGEGQYLWQPGIQAGQPDRLLSFPMDVSEYAPNTFTTGLYVGLLCDWSHYYIADALSMRIQRLTELYAATNQVGFIGRKETDGMPVLSEAFVRVKLA